MKMKSIVLSALVMISFAALVLSDTGIYYAPEYTEYQTPEAGVRTKRGVDPASLAFLVGVGAGGIVGPIIYNRLYGWKSASQGWQPEPQGWQPEPQGWQEPVKGWQEPAKGGY